jgi:hypothetical protein
LVEAGRSADGRVVQMGVLKRLTRTSVPPTPASSPTARTSQM